MSSPKTINAYLRKIKESAHLLHRLVSFSSKMTYSSTTLKKETPPSHTCLLVFKLSHRIQDFLCCTPGEAAPNKESFINHGGEEYPVFTWQRTEGKTVKVGAGYENSGC